MLKFIVGLVAVFSVVSSAQGQDTIRLQGTIGQLSSPVTAVELERLGEGDPNAYVYFLQQHLMQDGQYAGPANGQLTSATVSAIVRYCRTKGIVETCVRGPLLPQAIAAVSEAVVADLAPTPAEAIPLAEEIPAADIPAPSEESAAAQIVGENVSPEVPEGWRLNDNGGRGTLGLEVILVSAGATEAVLRFSGTAARDGYFNIELARAVAANQGNWTTGVTIARKSAAGSAGTVWLRTGQYAGKAYVGELFNGLRVEADADSTDLAGSGEPSAETTRLLPYVQLTVNEGDVVDTTLHLADPSLGRDD